MMNWRRLDLNLLKVMKALLDERSVTRAAEQLHVSPSAVSHALARLRRAFDDPLFVRVGSHMVATAGAEAMVRPLEQLIASLDNQLGPAATGSVPFDPAGMRRALRLVSPGALELTLIPAVAIALRRAAPEWSLTVEAFERRSYEGDLASGRVDLVVAVGGHTPANDVIGVQALWEDEMVVLAGPQSPAYAESDGLTMDAFLEQPHIYPLPWAPAQNYLDVKLGRSDRHRKLALRVPSYAGVGAAIENSDLLASMPDRTAAAVVKAYPSLRALRLRPSLRSPLSLLWALAGQRDPALAWARSMLVGIAEKLSP